MILIKPKPALIKLYIALPPLPLLRKINAPYSSSCKEALMYAMTKIKSVFSKIKENQGFETSLTYNHPS